MKRVLHNVVAAFTSVSQQHKSTSAADAAFVIDVRYSNTE